MLKIKCNNCKKDINKILLNRFNYDGSDSEELIEFSEIFNYESRGIVIRTDTNWTGYELTNEERQETISCPYCHKYPFNEKDEIETNEPVEIICFSNLVEEVTNENND